MSVDYNEMKELAEKLRKYAIIEGTEIGEVCGDLINCAQNISYYSDEFEEALYKEMQEQLENFKTKCVIVDRVRVSEIKYKELEWKE